MEKFVANMGQFIENRMLRQALEKLYVAAIYPDGERRSLRCEQCLREWLPADAPLHSPGCPMKDAELALGDDVSRLLLARFLTAIPGSR
jgi:hypothetical protein